MRLPLKTVKSEDLVLLVIGPTKYMDTDAMIVLEPAVLDPKPEHTGRDVGRLCGVSIIAWWLHQVSLASVAHTLVMYPVRWVCHMVMHTCEAPGMHGQCACASALCCGAPKRAGPL